MDHRRDKILKLGFVYQLSIIFDTLRTSGIFVPPLWVVFLDQFNKILFGLYVFQGVFLMDHPAADLTLILNSFRNFCIFALFGRGST
jgi:hypothetical protein